MGLEALKAGSSVAHTIHRGFDAAQALESVTWQVDDSAGRELVRNAARHAQPAKSEGRRLTVTAACGAGAIRVGVQDNGREWDARVTPGHGLELHTALMAIAGGSLTMESSPPAGVRAELTLPMGPSSQAIAHQSG